MAEVFSSSKKDTGLYNNEITSKDLKMKEITGRIQRDQDKLENFHKYNSDNIAEHKEKIVLYLKALEEEEKGLNLDDENDLELNHTSNGHSSFKPKLLKYKTQSNEGNYKYGLENSAQMTEYLEAKLDLLKMHRKKKFSEYFREKYVQTKNAKAFRKQNSLLQTKKINEIMNKNALKIEKQLLNLFELEETSSNESDTDESFTKKIKLTGDSTLSIKQVGYKTADFLRLPKYALEPVKLPLFSNLFDDAKEANFAFSSKGLDKGLKEIRARKIGDGENATDEAGILALKKAGKVELPVFYDEMRKKVLGEKDKENAKNKADNMTKAELEKHEKTLLKKQWQNVVRGVIRIYRFTQKIKLDVETNCKKMAIFCAKEVKKKIHKSQRSAKEYVFRAKRMHKEMLVFWRKREKELNELKKKKEKLEAEIRKRAEEERETLLQRRRLEFLMKQSDIYAHFMARKLGMDVEDEKKEGVEQQQVQVLPPPPGYQKVEIDEEEAFKSIQGLINDHRQYLKTFDEDTQKQRMEAGGPQGEEIHIENCDMNDLMYAQKAEGLDFSTVNLDAKQKIIEAPKSFHGTLKEYQLKGLRWLDNLYEQGINGILADEMGLGKTIQAISLLAHISESKGNWGPFLVVAPASTLFNWQQEIHRFAPNLRVLPYWGGLKERKTIRKFFQPRYWGSPTSQFHVVVTSYQLIVADEKSFQRLKWQYMVLDEAQAIKNTNSQRWKILLSFNTRNKLLLTGTPIQNTMAELWALLHFIMPKLFDSHEQFQEWFSKDIEANSADQNALNHHQLSRLHAILKPFMLRRVKKDVENEIGQKKEYTILCDMTTRQAELYNTIKSHLSLQDFFQMFESKAKVENLMNLVMQFRKVCNHPELFERRQSKTPLSFRNYYYYTGHHTVSFGKLKHVMHEVTNPITYEVPKLVYDDLYSNFDGREFLEKSLFIKKHFCLWDSDIIHTSLMGPFDKKEINHYYNIYSFSRFLNLSPAQVELCMKYDNFYTELILLHSIKTMNRVYSAYESVSLEDSLKLKTKNIFWINKNIVNYYNNDEPLVRELIKTPKTIEQDMLTAPKRLVVCYIPKVIAEYFNITCSSTQFTYQQNKEINARILSTVFYGSQMGHAEDVFSATENIPRLGLSAVNLSRRYSEKVLLDELFEGIFSRDPEENMSHVAIPSFESLIADSTKLKYLDKLLPKLKKNGHRVLIFCQMTKMMDILEEYLARRRYSFFRLDGSCTVADRRDMVSEFQENDNIFAFILSTRAGGLGVTLTAADVVIFYDNDWNPTMDAQATDRAHRIGQTKDVHVYRLITKGTVEERIVKRAQQKQNVQATVYSGGAFKADIFKPQDVVELLFDENELNANETKKFMAKGGSRKKPKKEVKETKAPGKGRGKKMVVEEDNQSNSAMDFEKNADKGGDKDGMELEFDFSNLMNEGVVEESAGDFDDDD